MNTTVQQSTTHATFDVRAILPVSRPEPRLENYRSILQSIVCHRYHDVDEAYVAIDLAYESEWIDEAERTQLEEAVRHFGTKVVFGGGAT